jgi:hypothetical protein
MAWEISTRRHVAADVDTVWEVLTAFDEYEEWNPTLPSVHGEAELGERLRVRLALPNGIRVPFRPVVTVVDPGRELRWEAGLPTKGVVDADHGFLLEPTDDGCVVEQVERFEGTFAEPLMGRFASVVRQGYDDMNDALAERAEARAD